MGNQCYKNHGQLMLQKPWATNVTKTMGNHISALKEDQTQYKRCIYIYQISESEH